MKVATGAFYHRERLALCKSVDGSLSFGCILIIIGGVRCIQSIWCTAPDGRVKQKLQFIARANLLIRFAHSRPRAGAQIRNVCKLNFASSKKAFPNAEAARMWLMRASGEWANYLYKQPSEISGKSLIALEQSLSRSATITLLLCGALTLLRWPTWMHGMGFPRLRLSYSWGAVSLCCEC